MNWNDSHLIRFYLKKYRKWISFGLLALLMVDSLEVLPPLLLKRSIDALSQDEPTRQLWRWGACYLAITVFQGFARFAWRMTLVRASMSSGRDLRGRLADKLLKLSPSFFDRHPIGDLMTLANSDVEAIRMSIGAGVIVFADAVFYLLTLTTAMFLLSPKLTLISFLALPFVPWLVIKNERQIHEKFTEAQKSFGELSAFAQESLMGIRVIKGLSLERERFNRFQAMGLKYREQSLKLAKIQSAFGPELDFITSFGLVALIYFGGRGMVEEAVTLGTFVAFQRYIQKLVWPVSAIGLAITHYQKAVASSYRMRKVLEYDSEIKEPESDQGVADLNQENVLEFRNLSFAYPHADQEVLSSIDLKIKRGERVAFLGRVGSGKTTLFSLIPKLYPVKTGQLLVFGKEINSFTLTELRGLISFVSQDVFLFSESIFENIALGLVSRTNSGEEIKKLEMALEKASIHQEVFLKPAGIHYTLGEKGGGLSGGQKHRLTLARAIVREAPILILDDVLSSVDSETEEKIIAGLNTLSDSQTLLISSQRLSVLKAVDRVVVLDSGRVVQEGTHEILFSQKEGAYFRWYEEQNTQSTPELD